jgi:tight adherence protein C
MTSLPLPAGLAALAGGIVLGVVALLEGYAGGGRSARGVGAIETFYSRAAPRPKVAEQAALELSPALDRLRALAVRLSPASTMAKLQRRLDMAGKPRRWTPERVLAYKGLGLFGLGLLGALLGLGQPMTLILYGGVGAAAGFFLPDLLVRNAGQKRQTAIRKALPDSLDMLTVCVEAGLGFDAALSQVARNTEGPLAAEFARVLQEMQFGKSRTEALRGLSERAAAAELRVFVSALVQASELGIPVAQVLREQAREMRMRRRQLAEEKAQKVPVKILFPLIFCLFPALFVVILGPGVIMIYHTVLHH